MPYHVSQMKIKSLFDLFQNWEKITNLNLTIRVSIFKNTHELIMIWKEIFIITLSIFLSDKNEIFFLNRNKFCTISIKIMFKTKLFYNFKFWLIEVSWIFQQKFKFSVENSFKINHYMPNNKNLMIFSKIRKYKRWLYFFAQILSEIF